MTSTFTIGRIFGIPIGLHFSWLFIFAWLTWALANNFFPNQYHDWSQFQYWGVAVVASLALFGSILAHELGHSVVAMRYGIRVKSITLFILGGIAQISREAPRPMIEGLIAVAGPVVSLSLGGIFIGLSILLDGVNDQAAALAGYVGWANIFVGLFNLLPGFPMDGGRLFRAVVWGIRGNYLQATKMATSLGKAFGYALIGGGVALGVWQGSVLSGLGGVLIGFFLLNASAQTVAQVTLREALRGVRVREIMNGDVPLIPRRIDLHTLVNNYIAFTGRTLFFVGDDGQWEGLLSVDDIKRVPREQWAATTVGDIMVSLDQVASVMPSDDAVTAMETMDEAEVSQIPVMESGYVVGLVGRDRLLALAKSRLELESHA